MWGITAGQEWTLFQGFVCIVNDRQATEKTSPITFADDLTEISVACLCPVVENTFLIRCYEETR